MCYIDELMEKLHHKAELVENMEDERLALEYVEECQVIRATIKREAESQGDMFNEIIT